MTEEAYITKTRYYQVDMLAPDSAIIEVAAETIRRGGLVAFPTETVYGLGANACDGAAVDKIFRAKGRPANDPLIVHIAALDQLPQVAIDIPDIAFALYERFCPGPLTLVLSKQAQIPQALTAGLDSVAVRIPSHAVALALIRASALPIAAPSANKFSRPSPTCAQHVLDDLDGHVDLVLDGGSCSIGVESTIVSLLDNRPKLLRAGGVSLEALREVVPDITYRPRYLHDDATAAPAPGNLLRHYSPRAKVVLFQGEKDADVYAAMREYISSHSKVGVMAMDDVAAHFAGLDVIVEHWGADLDEAALRLFAVLRALDRRGVEQILVRMPKTCGLGLAIGDRLLRAAVGQVIEVKPRT